MPINLNSADAPTGAALAWRCAAHRHVAPVQAQTAVMGDRLIDPGEP
jgi:hypothetical protein